jgi:hypothetical protein
MPVVWRLAMIVIRPSVGFLAVCFQLHHQIMNFGFRFPCNPGSIQCYYFAEPVETLVQNSTTDLFQPLPKEFDLAVIDRLHF